MIREEVHSLPPAVVNKWNAMRAAISAAAKPFTGSDNYAICIYDLHNLPDADVAMDAITAKVRKKIGADVHAQFELYDGTPRVRVCYRAGANQEKVAA